MIWRWVGWISFKKSHLLTACMSNKNITYFWNFMLWLILYLLCMMMLYIWFLAFYKIARLEKFIFLCLPPSMSLYSAPAIFFFLLIEESIVSFFVFSFLFSSISKKKIHKDGRFSIWTLFLSMIWPIMYNFVIKTCKLLSANQKFLNRDRKNIHSLLLWNCHAIYERGLRNLVFAFARSSAVKSSIFMHSCVPMRVCAIFVV